MDGRSLTGDQLRKNIITVEDFYKATQSTKPSVGQDQLKVFEDWTNNYGMKG